MNHLSEAIARELQAVMNGKKVGMDLGDLARMCADELSTRTPSLNTRTPSSKPETDNRVVGCWTKGTKASTEVYDWTLA